MGEEYKKQAEGYEMGKNDLNFNGAPETVEELISFLEKTGREISALKFDKKADKDKANAIKKDILALINELINENPQSTDLEKYDKRLDALIAKVDKLMNKGEDKVSPFATLEVTDVFAKREENPDILAEKLGQYQRKVVEILKREPFLKREEKDINKESEVMNIILPKYQNDLQTIGIGKLDKKGIGTLYLELMKKLKEPEIEKSVEKMGMILEIINTIDEERIKSKTKGETFKFSLFENNTLNNEHPVELISYEGDYCKLRYYNPSTVSKEYIEFNLPLSVVANMLTRDGDSLRKEFSSALSDVKQPEGTKIIDLRADWKNLGK